jgi:hypothetical protein
MKTVDDDDDDDDDDPAVKGRDRVTISRFVVVANIDVTAAAVGRQRRRYE